MKVSRKYRKKNKELLKSPRFSQPVWSGFYIGNANGFALVNEPKKNFGMNGRIDEEKKFRMQTKD